MGITQLSGYCAAANVRYGANGDTAQVDREYEVVNAAGSGVGGRRVWTGGAAGVTLTANPGGGNNRIEWAVDGGSTDPLPYTGVTYGTFAKIQVRAAARVPGVAAVWTDLVVVFFRSGVPRQTVTVDRTAWPVASTLGQSSTDGVESILTVTPLSTANTKVVITGKVQLLTDPGAYPTGDDVAGEIFLFTSTCAP